MEQLTPVVLLDSVLQKVPKTKKLHKKKYSSILHNYKRHLQLLINTTPKELEKIFLRNLRYPGDNKFNFVVLNVPDNVYEFFLVSCTTKDLHNPQNHKAVYQILKILYTQDRLILEALLRLVSGYTMFSPYTSAYVLVNINNLLTILRSCNFDITKLQYHMSSSTSLSQIWMTNLRKNDKLLIGYLLSEWPLRITYKKIYNFMQEFAKDEDVVRLNIKDFNYKKYLRDTSNILVPYNTLCKKFLLPSLTNRFNLHWILGKTFSKPKLLKDRQQFFKKIVPNKYQKWLKDHINEIRFLIRTNKRNITLNTCFLYRDNYMEIINYQPITYIGIMKEFKIHE